MINAKSITALLILSLATSACLGQEINAEPSIDLNNDGVEDVHFKYDSEGYYQLTDRNFDGKIDESARYNLDHYLLSSRSDDNFDGIFETTIEYKHSLISRILVDTNDNQIVDLVHNYKHSLIVSTEKYQENDGAPSVTQVIYKFDYPVSQRKTEHPSMTELQFQQSVISK